MEIPSISKLVSTFTVVRGLEFILTGIISFSRTDGHDEFVNGWVHGICRSRSASLIFLLFIVDISILVCTVHTGVKDITNDDRTQVGE